MRFEKETWELEFIKRLSDRRKKWTPVKKILSSPSNSCKESFVLFNFICLISSFYPGIQWFFRLPGAGANHLHGALPGAQAVVQDGPVAPAGLQTGRTVLLWSQARVRHCDSPTAAHHAATPHPSSHRHHFSRSQQVGSFYLTQHNNSAE